MILVENLILGAGISGLSASYHIGHEKCLLLEKNSQPFGLLRSTESNGFVWDQGPHVSFTKSDYVKNLFAKNVEDLFYEHSVSPVSYYYGDWLNHPIQSNLFQLSRELKERCINSYLKEKEKHIDIDINKTDYRTWLERSLGKEITNLFVAPYTRKYWTTDPQDLSIDWIGPRIYQPSKSDILESSKGPLKKESHYISKVRYPINGGYESFVSKMASKANIKIEHEIVEIDPIKKIVFCKNGEKFSYKKLISTIPLPLFVSFIKSLDSEVYKAANDLVCSELLLINLEVPSKVTRKEHWLYIYDEDKYSTRITIMDNLAKSNSPRGMSGIQVEVYSSKYKPLEEKKEVIAQKVISELFDIGLIDKKLSSPEEVNWHINEIPYANVIFDHKRRKSLDLIFCSLEQLGLTRVSYDLDALTDWNLNPKKKTGDICLLGRFGEWKYYWSDDCILAGKSIV